MKKEKPIQIWNYNLTDTLSTKLVMILITLQLSVNV